MSQLAEWYVTLATRGQDKVKDEINAIKDTLDQAKSPAEQLRDRLKELEAPLLKAREQGKLLEQGLTTAFERAKNGVLGFVHAGLQGTAEGNRLADRFQRLSQEIASLFLPQIEKVTAWLERVNAWFASLSRTQQESIGRWLTFAAIAGTVLVMLPRIVSAVNLLTTAMKVMGREASIAGGVLGALIAASPAIAASIRSLRGETKEQEEAADNERIDRLQRSLDTGKKTIGNQLGKFFMASELERRQQEKKEGNGHRSVTLAGGGFEGITGIYNRIAEAGARTNIAQAQLDEQKRTNELLNKIVGAGVAGAGLAGQVPAVGN